MKILKILLVISKTLTRIFYGIVKGIVRFLGLARNKIVEHLLALIVYLAISVLAVMLFKFIPLFQFKIVAIGAVCLMTALLTTIRFRYGDISEHNISKLRREKAAAEEKLLAATVKAEKELQASKLHAAELEDRLKREKMTFYGMDWVWEIAITERSGEYRKTFDYYIPSGSSQRTPWAQRPEELNKGDKRATGSLSIPYKATISIDLRQVLYDPITNRFSIPEPLVSVKANGDSRTDELRLALEYHKPLLKTGLWVLRDEKDWQLPVWEQEAKQAFDHVLAMEMTYEQVGESVRIEAERRVAELLRLVTGKKSEPVAREQLQEPKLLSIFWDEISKDADAKSLPL